MRIYRTAPTCACYPSSKLLIGTLALFLLCAGSQKTQGQTCLPTDTYLTGGTTTSKAGPPTLQIVAIGTSVMWGNGLREKQTFRHQVADWLALQTGRPVELTTFAHSGSLLVRESASGTILQNPALAIGDLNASLPTVDEQIDCAAATPNSPNPDLILIEGCINDVGAEDIVYPWTNSDELESKTIKWCGHMAGELRKIKTAFPHARVVVVGYYPLVSYESPIFGWFGTRRLAKHSSKVHAARHPADRLQAKQQKPRHEERGIIADNSENFYQDSKKALITSVASVNESTVAKYFYANLPEVTEEDGTVTVDPRFAFGASEQHQWSIPIRILFFWAILKDNKYWYRQPLCKKYVDNPIDRLVCDSNTAFHPNDTGAIAYAEAIERAVPPGLIAEWREFHPPDPFQ